MSNRTLYLTMLVLFTLVPVAIGGLIYREVQRDQARAQVVADSEMGSTEQGPFFATATFVASSPPVESVHQKLSCLAYQTRVLQTYTYEKEGREETKQYPVFRQRGEADDIRAKFKSGEQAVDLESWSEPMTVFYVVVEEPPDYVHEEELQDLPEESTTFEVREWTIEPDREYLLGGNLSGDLIGPHPEFGTLVVYPGTQQQLVDSFRAKSSNLWIGIYGCIIFIVISWLIIGNLLRKELAS